MEQIKILKNQVYFNWGYNEESDIFYLSIGSNKTPISMDMGDGLIVHYDEINKEVIGLNLTGLREKVQKKLESEAILTEEEKELAVEERKVVEDKESATFGKQLFDHGGEA